MPRLSHKTILYGIAGGLGGSTAWVLILKLSGAMAGGLLTETALGAIAGAQTVPQVFINGQRIGGFEELKRWAARAA